LKTSKAIDLFIASRRALDVSPRTITGYEWALSKIAEGHPDDLPTTEMEINEIFAANEHLSIASRNNLRIHLKVFWAWLERNHLAKNLTHGIRSIGGRKRYPYTLNMYDVARMFDAALSVRDYILMNLFLDTGVRLGEATSITRERINATDGYVTVTGKAGDRLVP